MRPSDVECVAKAAADAAAAAAGTPRGRAHRRTSTLLESFVAERDVLVIDRLERPSEN
jgi:hypothetical protein